MQPEFQGKRCLVTGGTGFIGGRLVESLAADGAEIRVLVRDLSKASRIGRFPVQLVRGDLASLDDVRRAAEGCDTIFHCACGNTGDESVNRASTVDGTEHVVRVARELDARLVHVSTVSVYGAPRDGELDETTPRRPDGDFYAETKLQAENTVLDACKTGLRGSVIQPTIVYGPFGPAWTVRTFAELESGRVMLIDGGEGLCNVVYVDDVVQGMRLAAVRDEAIGEVFLISGPEPVTWREFYAAHEALLGNESHVERTAEEALALFEKLYGDKPKHLLREGYAIVRETPSLRSRLKSTREVQAFLRAAKLVVPAGARKTIQNKLRGVQPKSASASVSSSASANGTAAATKPPRPVHPMAPAGIQMAKAKTRVSIEKARRLLGYEPKFGFDAGMARVADWARWAGVLPSEVDEASSSS